jgi:hypothetical protein
LAMNFITRRNVLAYALSAVLVGGTFLYSPPANAGLESTVKKQLQKYIGKIAQYIAAKYLKEAEDILQDWSKDLKKNGQESFDKVTVGFGAMADTINKQTVEQANSLLKIESQPSIFSNAFTGKFFQAEMDAQQQVDDAVKASLALFTKQLEETKFSDIAGNLKQYGETVSGRLKAGFLDKDLDVSTLLGESGYLSEEDLNSGTTFLYLLIAESYLFVESPTEPQKQSVISQVAQLYEIFLRMHYRKVRNESLYETCMDSLPGHTNEQSILSEDLKGKELGISLVELRRFEIERRWLNKQWHDSIDNLTSQTALYQELNDQLAYRSRLLRELMLQQERIQMAESIAALNHLERGRAKTLRREAV